jgi:hypothetical protein
MFLCSKFSKSRVEISRLFTRFFLPKMLTGPAHKVVLVPRFLWNQPANPLRNKLAPVFEIRALFDNRIEIDSLASKDLCNGKCGS